MHDVGWGECPRALVAPRHSPAWECVLNKEIRELSKMKCCLKTGFVAFLEEGGGQCDQMIKLFLYLAIYSNKNLPQNLHKICAEACSVLCQIPNQPLKYCQKILNKGKVAKIFPIWSHRWRQTFSHAKDRRRGKMERGETKRAEFRTEE